MLFVAQVPPHLTSRQKKQLLLNIPKEDHLHYLQTLTDIKAHWSVRAERKRKENKEMQLFVDMKEDTFIYANERKFFYTYIKHRMAQTFLTGMPIVFDVGYPMDSGDIASFLKVLCRAHYLAKHHKQPANLIVSGLSKNPEMKVCVQLTLYIQSNLDISNSDISNSAKVKASILIKNTF